MAYDLEEQEKLANLKAWWDRWGNLVSGVATVVALAMAGWFGWQYWQRTQAQKAGLVYEEYTRQVAAKGATARELADKLRNDYAGTVYATLAALGQARALHEAGDLAGAREQLKWVVEKAGRGELADVARVRLAGVLLDEKNYDEALKVLDAAPSEAKQAAFEDRRGDVLAAQGKVEDARAAWQRALKAGGERHPLRGLVQRKLDMLPAEAGS